jgi:chemotaxis protein CheX
MASLTTGAAQIGAYAAHLDAAVDEVFSMMMGEPCTPVDEYPVEERETISAVIGLAGAMSGNCVLRVGEQVAMTMASTLSGFAVETIDDTVKDALGEISNMVAGAWKGRQPLLASGCMLSTPTVVSGTNYQLHTQKPEFRIERYYRFSDCSFGVTLVCEATE